MKKVFFAIGFIFLLTRVLFADEPEKLRISDYYIGQENTTDTVNYAIAKWKYSTATTPYYTTETIYDIEIELYKNGNIAPIEKIILQNGRAGGNQLVFEKANLTDRKFSSQTLIGIYTEFDDGESGYVIRIYEAENIGPNTELLTLVLVRENG